MNMNMSTHNRNGQA